MGKTQTPQRDVFHAIADPTRRALLDLIAKHDQPVKDLARSFAMSRPAISQHLRVLEEAGLIMEKRAGREHRYQLQATPLSEVSNWLTQYEHFWQNHLERLGEHLDSMNDKEEQ